MNHVYNQDQLGNKVPHGVISGDPVAASGQTLDQTSSTAITVVAGATYLVTPGVGYVCLGLATVATAANILWIANVGQTIAIKIPVGTTTLYYICVGSSPKAFLRKLAEQSHTAI